MRKTFMKNLISLSLVMALVISSSFQVYALPETKAPVKAGEVVYNGFLIDSNCGVKGYDAIHKIDLKKSPEKHTTECMKMKECMGSGLGISVKQANGTYKFTKFDTAGSKLADDKIMMMTKKKFNNKVAVKVNLSGATFNLLTIKEAQ